MRKKAYTEEQLNILKQYYPDGKWNLILPCFPGKSQAGIRAIARKNGLRRIRENIKDNDLTGQRFGKLVAISRVSTGNRSVQWLCRCDCGTEKIINIYNLINGTTKSCGCKKHSPSKNFKDFTGRKFGLLTAVERLPRYKGGNTFYRCTCECGREKIVSSGNLSSGHTQSCGVTNHTRKEYKEYETPLDDIKRTYSIYRHISPSEKSYIGITMQDPQRRFQNGAGYKTQPAFYRAIEKYGWENFRHEIIEDHLTEREACEKERYYINEVYKTIAPDGYNSREGGFHGRHHVTPVIQYYSGVAVNFFESITIASEALGIAQETIHKLCGVENSIDGYFFDIMDPIAPYNIPSEYLELCDEPHRTAIKQIIARKHQEKTIARNKKTAKPINKYDLDGHYICTFSSIIDAQKSIGTSDGGAICAAVNPNREGETAYGFMWKYDTGDHGDIDPVKYKAQRSVLAIDPATGKVYAKYKSMSEASKALNISMRKTKKSCTSDGYLVNGLQLRYNDEKKIP